MRRILIFVYFGLIWAYISNAQELKTVSAMRSSFLIFNKGEDSLQLKALKYPSTSQIIFFFFAAEEDPIGLDPGLSTDGRWRAINIISILKEFEPTSIFSTPFRRNILTLQPFSDARRIDIQYYDQADLKALLDKLKKLNSNDAIVMVHKETVSKIIESLTGLPFTDKLENSCSDRIFVLERPMNGQAILHSFRYDIR